MIYGYERGCFKIKDPKGTKYKIPISRPDLHQVRIKISRTGIVDLF